MALHFQDYLEREYAKGSATTDFTFTLIPRTGGARLAFTILNAGAADVKTHWEVLGDRVYEIPLFNPNYGAPSTTTTE